MYSSIANNSFSYLLTLDDIRKALPDETRPSWIKITTITMVSSFIQMIDIKSFGKPLKVSGRTACTARERTQLDLNGN